MDSLNTSLAVLSTVGTVFSAAAAGAALFAARRANGTADSVARIERDRWHTDLTPRLHLEIQQEPQLRLAVRFDGPAGLRVLNRLVLTIRDDRDRSRDNQLAGAATPEQMAAIIWGPYQFRPRMQGVDETGRVAEVAGLHLDDTWLFALDPSTKASWYEGPEGSQRWHDQYNGTPLRLWAECHAAGHQPWTLPCTVNLPASR